MADSEGTRAIAREAAPCADDPTSEVQMIGGLSSGPESRAEIVDAVVALCEPATANVCSGQLGEAMKATPCMVQPVLQLGTVHSSQWQHTILDGWPGAPEALV